MKRVIFSLPDDLLNAIDREAASYYMTRSDLIRRALVWYLQPESGLRSLRQAQEDEPSNLYSEPEELLKILQHQRLRNGVQTILRDMRRQREGRRINK